ANAGNDTYTLSLHDALPICCLVETQAERAASRRLRTGMCEGGVKACRGDQPLQHPAPDPGGRGQCRESESGGADAGKARLSHGPDRKSTRLNSSHQIISYAV